MPNHTAKLVQKEEKNKFYTFFLNPAGQQLHHSSMQIPRATSLCLLEQSK
jgi:hypothetical protein